MGFREILDSEVTREAPFYRQLPPERTYFDYFRFFIREGAYFGCDFLPLLAGLLSCELLFQALESKFKTLKLILLPLGGAVLVFDIGKGAQEHASQNQAYGEIEIGRGFHEKNPHNVRAVRRITVAPKTVEISNDRLGKRYGIAANAPAAARGRRIPATNGEK
jgi:hypothetical protein